MVSLGSSSMQLYLPEGWLRDTLIWNIDSVMFHSHKKTGEKLPVLSVKDRYEPIAKQQCHIFVAWKGEPRQRQMAYCSPTVRLLFVYCSSIVRLLFVYCSSRSPIFSQHIERLRTGEEATWSSIHRQRHWQLSRFCWPHVMQCRYIRFARWLQWLCWPTYELRRNTKSGIGCGSKKKAKRLVRWNIL